MAHDTSKMIQLTIVYDNYAFKPGLETAWGFACLIEGFEQTILFDTGGDAAIFQRNMTTLGIEPHTIDALVLSHAHWDHQNGIPALLDQHADLTAYFLKSFPGDLKLQAAGYGASVFEVQGALTICENVFSTGQLGSEIPEQALVLRTPRGLIIVTGCAHPGVVEIVRKAKDMFREEVLLIMGGFHLYKRDTTAAEGIVHDFRALGVLNIAPTHCSGDPARQLFQEAYGANFIQVGVGKALRLEDIP